MASTQPLQPGETFNRLTVIGFDHRNSNRHRMCRVACTCGNVKVLRETAVKRGEIKSCGCLLTEELRNRLAAGKRPCFKHGMRNTPEYYIFDSAKQRCRNPRNHAFKDYGGRGIEFRFDSFEDFLSELGKRPSPDHSIDRIDNNGHYETGNVRWATAKDQAANRRPWTANARK